MIRFFVNSVFFVAKQIGHPAFVPTLFEVRDYGGHGKRHKRHKRLVGFGGGRTTEGHRIHRRGRMGFGGD